MSQFLSYFDAGLFGGVHRAEDFGTTEAASDHRTDTNPDKRNVYLVDVALLNNVYSLHAVEGITSRWSEYKSTEFKSVLPLVLLVLIDDHTMIFL